MMFAPFAVPFVCFFLLDKILRKPIQIYGIGTGIVTEHSLSTRMLACMDIWELYWNLFLSSAAPSCFQRLHGLKTVSLISSTRLSIMSASLNAVVPYTLKWDVPMLPELCVVSVLTFLIFGRCFGGQRWTFSRSECRTWMCDWDAGVRF